jgi:fumarylpyruvate hydrolase
VPETHGQRGAARLTAAVEAMLAAVAALPADQVAWHPAPGVWSVMDIVCHVQEALPYWTAQTQRAIETPGEPWGRSHTDRDRLAAVADTASRSLRDVVTAIDAAARQSAAALVRFTDAQLAVEATSRNPRFGRRRAQFIVDHLIVEHVEKHLGQIRRNVNQYQQRDTKVTDYVFAPPTQPAVPVRGRSRHFPIRRIFCVGRNYEDHAKEMGAAVDREAPFYFMKASDHYVASGATVPYPPGTKNYHHEMEMVVAIGTAGFRIAEAQALGHVFGYACGFDMTRRDLQAAAKDKQRPWDVGKNVEQSAVVGDIAPASEIGHPSHGVIELRINGVTKQSGNLSMLIHGVAAVVADLSKYYHLQPGDLIYTGTPAGVGPVKPGDRLEGSIEGIGTVALQIGEPE